MVYHLLVHTLLYAMVDTVHALHPLHLVCSFVASVTCSCSVTVYVVFLFLTKFIFNAIVPNSNDNVTNKN